HDRAMLMQGSYPLALKRRVAADYGHLSNEQAAQLLQRVAHPELHVMIGHISEQNNDPSKVLRAFDGLSDAVASLGIANQAHGFDWVGERPITRQISFDKVM
ncbi:MAG: MBL fold metallo-hydrolase, partial [Pseudomonadota bacterium]|nr:MBL fold metallo-hydrolase [Pseudomonadota bacterium]